MSQARYTDPLWTYITEDCRMDRAKLSYQASHYRCIITHIQQENRKITDRDSESSDRDSNISDTSRKGEFTIHNA